MSGPSRQGWRRAGSAALSGALASAAFPGIDQGWVAFFAFVPLLLAIRGLRARAAAGYAWIAGFVFFLFGVYWIPNTISSFTSIPESAAVGILLLMAAAASYGYVFFGLGLEWIATSGIPRLLAAPVLWVVCDWARNFVIAEFPWNLLGYSQLWWLPMAQAADLGGVYLLSGAVMLVNVALAEAVVARRALRGASVRTEAARAAGVLRWRVAAMAGLAAAVPVLLAVYGTARLAWLRGVPYTGEIRIAVAQGNIAQDQKWDKALQERIFATYLDLTRRAADAGARIVVWPEAALPFYLARDMRSVKLVEVARERGIDLLVGSPGLDDHDGGAVKPWNQAWLVRADGNVEGPYDKIQLVPFGEYIPLHGLFGMVDVAVQTVGQLGRGAEFTVFDSAPLAAVAGAQAGARSAAGRPVRLAPLICYEGIFPGLVREFASRGTDVLVNISNDAWYGDTSAPWQHLRMAMMRSIENRLPMVRSTNTGISAFVTDTGSVGPTTPLFEEDMALESVLVREVWSFYRIYGDVFLSACQAGVGMMVLVSLRGRRRRSGGI